jgi:hypothetical protein
MADNKSERIKAWQNKLLAVFSYNGAPGGPLLANAVETENETGTAFLDKYYGHRVLTDSFLEFFGETLFAQWAYNNSKGWPQNEPHYVPCLILYLTVYRSIRSSEVLSANGYALRAYAEQRSIKDQLMILGAAASGYAQFDELFGWDGMEGKEWNEVQKAQVIKRRQKVESKVKERTIGKKSGLTLETKTQLENWDRLFNLEVHRAHFSYMRALHRLFVDRELSFALGPVTDDLSAAMFLNRSMELNWIALRLIPYLRRSETPSSDDWNMKWNLLEDSFKFMFDGFNELGKKIAPAYYEMLQTKFKFDPDTYFSVPKAGKNELNAAGESK